MTKKTIFGALVLALLLGVGMSVHAITLTKEATEKVVLKQAVRASLVGSPDEIVFGFAEVYPKGAPANTEPSHMAIFVYQDKLYRSAGYGPKREQVNCRVVTVQDPPEKGGLSRQQTICDEGRVLGEEGGGSLVNPDGTETNSIFTYFIGTDANGDVNDLEFNFNGADGTRDGGTKLKLDRILKVVNEPFEWRAQ